VLSGVGAEYTRRRNFFLDCLVENFHLEPGSSSKGGFKGFDVYFASIDKGKGQIQGPIFSFVPPTSGMFVWVSLRPTLFSASYLIREQDPIPFR
jgi:aromatic amino acid aminotransferase I